MSYFEDCIEPYIGMAEARMFRIHDLDELYAIKSWRTADGEVIKIRDMDEDHIKNALKYCEHYKLECLLLEELRKRDMVITLLMLEEED